VKTVTSATYMDFSSTDKLDTFYYYIEALSGLNQSLATSDTIQAIENTMTDAELMDMVQKYTFRYFWDEGHPVSGMARERNNSEDIVTTGGSGFGIMGILVGIENGYITRSEGANRIIKIISFLQYAEKFHGAFPHWMNGRTGKVVPFSQFDNGGDLVETAFLMQGLLAARQFFDVNNNTEKAIRQIITKLYEDVEWDWYSKNNSGVLYWHWSPNYAWQMNFPLRGYNEAMIVYLLAIASPTHSVPASYYHNGWAAANNYKNGNTWFGYKLFVGPAYGGPLFFAHYSFLGFDPRGIKDKYANYFENNRNHTLINRGWCIYNPLKHKKYSENSWGLTASDNPFGYSAHEPGSRDNGTIAPTAALSSMPYTPTESIAALRHFYLVEGESLFGPNGFYDAFNGDQNWVADSYLAIDQGPILVMLQNHRTELLWNMFMKNPEIKPALDAIGFVPDLTATSDANDIIKMALYPNPTTGKVKLVFDRERPNQIIIFDNTGNIVKNFKRMVEIESLDEIELIPSLYFIQANFEGNTEIIKLIVY
ncbi:MAG TPA: glucoamylase family protein, partial [Saprospiraceae bacterium]|nr:glucoamylase family protein [Saprospiraceae bacterium]